jgi:hypothetical protein
MKRCVREKAEVSEKGSVVAPGLGRPVAVLLTYGVKLLLDLSLAAVTAQPIADHLPRFVLV